MLNLNILLLRVNTKFYMHCYLCIVRRVDETMRRCTLLNINANERDAKIKREMLKMLLELAFIFLILCARPENEISTGVERKRRYSETCAHTTLLVVILPNIFFRINAEMNISASLGSRSS